jgi:hypothetical protein
VLYLSIYQSSICLSISIYHLSPIYLSLSSIYHLLSMYIYHLSISLSIYQSSIIYLSISIYLSIIYLLIYHLYIYHLPIYSRSGETLGQSSHFIVVKYNTSHKIQRVSKNGTRSLSSWSPLSHHPVQSPVSVLLVLVGNMDSVKSGLGTWPVPKH